MDLLFKFFNGEIRINGGRSLIKIVSGLNAYRNKIFETTTLQNFSSFFHHHHHHFIAPKISVKSKT